MRQASYKLLIIDDHRLFADGLSLVLSQAGDYQVSTFYNARTVLDDEALLCSHDLVLVDLDMPGLDGFGFLQGLAARACLIKVIVVSGVESRLDIKRLLQLGASGFLPKNSPSQIMLEGVEIVLGGGQYVPPHIAREINWAPLSNGDGMSGVPQPGDAIRPRQLEVLALIKQGHGNKQIAQILDISESTVKSHIKILFVALGAQNRTACVQKGIEKGLL